LSAVHPLYMPMDLTRPKAHTEGGEGEVAVRLWTIINKAETIFLIKCCFFSSSDIQRMQE